MNYTVIQYVYLTNEHSSTFRTVHKIGDKVIDKPYKLQIVKYKNCNGFYLIHLNINEEEMTDTYHDTLEDAMEQADWEFGINKKEWVKL